MSIERALHEIMRLKEKADVRYPIRVSISFGDDRDRALFELEMMRELKPARYPDQHLNRGPGGVTELQAYGITVRLV